MPFESDCADKLRRSSAILNLESWSDASTPALTSPPTPSRLDAAWALRELSSAGDSLYAALAIRAGEPLLTSDTRLARAANDTGINVRKPT
jgi:predicted nucleic acid-binding protein